VPQGQRI